MDKLLNLYAAVTYCVMDYPAHDRSKYISLVCILLAV